MKMTIKEFADGLNGREYGSEITDFEDKRAKELGYVVVFGYSDDNMEFRGAINDEIGCYNGGEVHLSKDKIFAPWDFCHSYDEDRPCELIELARKGCKVIESLWCDVTNDCAWSYKTDIPHEIFNIYEDGRVFCKGIVFSTQSL